MNTKKTKGKGKGKAKPKSLYPSMPKKQTFLNLNAYSKRVDVANEVFVTKAVEKASIVGLKEEIKEKKSLTYREGLVAKALGKKAKR